MDETREKLLPRITQETRITAWTRQHSVTPVVHEASLYGMNAKYADVVSEDEVPDCIRQIADGRS
jgi:hypothetical protein